jgi:hypothetical protein
MCLKSVVLFCVVCVTVVQSLGLEDPFRSGCVFNFVGADASTNSTIQGNVSASEIRGRDCVLIFRNLQKGKIRLTFKMPPMTGSKKKNILTEKEEEKQQRYVFKVFFIYSHKFFFT